MSPTGQSLKLLRDWSFMADVVERWIPRLERRRDCFGGFDLLAIDPRERRTWLIQCTTAGNLAARVKKLQGLPTVPKLLAAGIRCEVWGWFKRADRWDVRRVELRGEDCEPVELAPRPRRGRRLAQKGLFDDAGSPGRPAATAADP
jgi:hypothetical protein